MAARQPMRPLGKRPLKMHPRKPLKKYVTLKVIEQTAKKLSNWGKWGPNDELGTLYTLINPVVVGTAMVGAGQYVPLVRARA